MANKYQNIIIDIVEEVAILRFNRPDQLNAMNRTMMDEIIDGINKINANDQIRVAMILGEGRAFMAGADIKEYANQTPEEFVSFQKKGCTLYEGIENATIPWIAAINGYALGGGFEIALSCDMILASTTAKMGLPEVFLSLVPGGGGTQRLIQRIGINRAKEVLYTGAQFSAETFHLWGIVNHVYEEGTFKEEAINFAKKLSRRSPKAINQLKSLANMSLLHLPFEQKIEEEGKAVTHLFYSKEAQEAIQKFMEKN